MTVPEPVGQNRRRGHDRAGPTAAPHLIDSGNDGNLRRTQTALELPSKGIAAAHHDAGESSKEIRIDPPVISNFGKIVISSEAEPERANRAADSSEAKSR
jgi:hypothetical protein